MKIEIKLDEKTPERKVIILTEKVDEQIREIIRRLSREHSQVLAGFREDQAVLLEQKQILRIYASAGKVMAVTDRGEYILKQRLYELEERLDGGSFVRISNSEIVNLHHVKGFDLSYTGTIRVSLSDGESTFVSRRYIKKIKQVLGL